MTTEPLVTFFMIVTDRDIVIADYAVRSYARISGVPFRLVVYSNWVLSRLKEQYFPGWRELPYVEIRDNPEHRDDAKPDDRRNYGPFEMCWPIWDRELQTLRDTPFHATVDPDFEILDGAFVNEMVARLQANPKLGAISTDYNPRWPRYYDTYSREVIALNERWHTHCCMYRREVLDCPVSHAYHEEKLDGFVTRDVWDDTGWFQRALRVECGWELAVLEKRWQRCFIHYAAFVQNRHIDEHNVRLYRRLMIARKVGSLGTRLAARLLQRVIYWKVDRSTAVPGWSEN